MGNHQERVVGVSVAQPRWEFDRKLSSHNLRLSYLTNDRPTGCLFASVSLPIGKSRAAHVRAVYLCDGGRYDWTAQHVMSSTVAECKAWCERTLVLAREWLDAMERRGEQP